MQQLPIAPDVEESARERTSEGLARVGLEVLGLAAIVLPEIVLTAVGALVGLGIGVLAGVTWTGELFEGPGPWARAGPIALLFPVLTFFGPILLGTLIGAAVVLPLVLAVHALVLVPLPRRDRHAVIWVSAASYWAAGLLGLPEGLEAALGSLLILGPFLGALGLVGSLTWLVARVVLRGRSVAVWWRTGDRSMLAAALLLAIAGTAILWFFVVLFPLLPVAPIALVGSTVLCVRLAVARGRWVVPTGIALANVAHLGLLTYAVVAVATQR